MNILVANYLHLPNFIVSNRLEVLDPFVGIEFISAMAPGGDDVFELENCVLVKSEILTFLQIETSLSQPITVSEQETIVRFSDSRVTAKTIPSWATWNQSDWQTYFDANLSDAQADLVTSLAAARVMIKRQNLVIYNLARIVIAMRDGLWPNLPE